MSCASASWPRAASRCTAKRCTGSCSAPTGRPPRPASRRSRRSVAPCAPAAGARGNAQPARPGADLKGVSHAPVSVVVTASGSPDDFAACLSSLRPSLGARDEVVCVVPADRPDLRRELARQRWLTVLDAPAGDRAAGVAATTHPLVVLLDGDVIVSPQWLDPVVEAFADPDVVAAGPRCHRSYGPQGGVHLPRSAMADAAAFKTYARQWRQRYRDDVRTVDRLGPVCVAVRRDAFERAGATLSYEHLRTQGRLVVVNSVLVAHIGAVRGPGRGPPPG